MNSDRILLYDDYCPLCTWYSGLFVKFGLLSPGNRIPFSKVAVEILASITRIFTRGGCFHDRYRNRTNLKEPLGIANESNERRISV